MDLTHSFRTLVQQETSKQHARLSTSEKPSTRPDLFPPKRPSLAHPTNAFLSEAYILAKHLHSLRQRVLDIRPAYLNLPQTARQRRAVGRTKLSDPERDEIDQSVKATVRSMLGQIQSLNELGDSMVEQIEDDEGPRELLRRFVGALDPRNAGRPAQSTRLSRRDSMAALHSSVVWWLNARLRRTHQIHAEMQDLYLQHKLERQRGLLQQQQHQREHTRNMRSSNLQRDDEVLQSLSPQQLQQLQAENETMVGEFEHMLDSVHDTQRSVAEISALQSQLATELNAQMQQTEQLYNEAVGAVGAVEKGNDFLVAARKNQASARKWVLFVFIMLSIVLLFLDWFD
ncbi:hypothetical protein H4S02_004317 [Coemansia sp. RSA 2611]|nr:hypothetical protein IWW51_004829 [Coemansia sp. RSA 2702]KAJ2363683.1 hypothetical protein H4S01_004172 [Coemansia sp. RSA 2610]KAJ2385464.1 hypothetical protein H4S02_004317 [Coemansia sp. RSA 2611]